MNAAALPLAARLGLIVAAGMTIVGSTMAADLGVNFARRTVPGLDMVLVQLPKGSVVMGNPEGAPNTEPDESPPTRVNFTSDFWIGATEVTVAQWRYFADVTGYITDAEVSGAGLFLIKKKAGDRQIGLTWRNPGYAQEENHPVVGISWNDAQRFCRWLTEREQSAGRLPAGYVFTLPTEAQWEYACRAGQPNEPENINDYAWYRDTSGGTTHPVATKKPNAWGLYDMQGNVWEWVFDWYGRYPGGEVTDYAGPATPNDRNVISPHHELRGGGKGDPPGHGIASTNRWSTTGNTENDWVGLRIALAVPPAPKPPAFPAAGKKKK